MHSYQTGGVWSTDQLTNEAAGVSQHSYIDVDSNDYVLIGFEMFWDLHTLASNLTGNWAYTTVHPQLRNNGGLVIGSGVGQMEHGLPIFVPEIERDGIKTYQPGSLLQSGAAQFIDSLIA